MFISEQVLMLVSVGFLFIVAALAGAAIGVYFSNLNNKLNQRQPIPVATAPAYQSHTPTTVSTVQYSSDRERPPMYGRFARGQWKTHIITKVPAERAQETIDSLNARGIKLQSVTQANGDRHVTIYADEWIEN